MSARLPAAPTTAAPKHYDKRNGSIPLPRGHIFCWTRMRSGEVYGWIETPRGALLCGTSGWWRTDDEHAAAGEAQERFSSFFN